MFQAWTKLRETEIRNGAFDFCEVTELFERDGKPEFAYYVTNRYIFNFT